jgi:hypothetical protein
MATKIGIPATANRKWNSEKINILKPDKTLVEPIEMQRQMDKLREQLDRLAGQLPSFEEHDVDFLTDQPTPVLHSLGRVPTGFLVTFCDFNKQFVIYPATDQGWGHKVVYFTSDTDCAARIRLF